MPAGGCALFSGSTFAVALLGLFLVPTNVMRSLAAGAIIVGAVSVAAALTLLPAVLTIMGDRINALRAPFLGTNLGRADAGEARIWRSAISRVMRHPGISLALAAGFMALLAVPVLGLHIGQSGVATLPDSAMSKQGYLAINHYFAGQDPNPVEIVAVGNRPAVRTDLAQLGSVLARDSRFGAGAVRDSASGSIQTLTVPIRGDATSNADVAAVRDLHVRLIPQAFAGSGAKVLVGGTTAVTADYFHAVTTPTSYVLLFVLGISFLLLLVAFRSLTAALLSVALNLLAVGTAYGLLNLVFIHGVGAGVFGFQHVDAIDAWVPLFLFSVLFALSMDYQVFLMSRIKERYDHSGSTRDAVINGVSSTARIITGAALIIVIVFSGSPAGSSSCSSRWASEWPRPCSWTPPSSAWSSSPAPWACWAAAAGTCPAGSTGCPGWRWKRHQYPQPGRNKALNPRPVLDEPRSAVAAQDGAIRDLRRHLARRKTACGRHSRVAWTVTGCHFAEEGGAVMFHALDAAVSAMIVVPVRLRRDSR